MKRKLFQFNMFDGPSVFTYWMLFDGTYMPVIGKEPPLLLIGRGDWKAYTNPTEALTHYTRWAVGTKLVLENRHQPPQLREPDKILPPNERCKVFQTPDSLDATWQTAVDFVRSLEEPNLGELKAQMVEVAHSTLAEMEARIQRTPVVTTTTPKGWFGLIACGAVAVALICWLAWSFIAH